MSAMACQITGVSIVCSALCSGPDKKIKAPRHWPLLGKTTGFPSQRASNAENVSIWWRHHGIVTDITDLDYSVGNSHYSRHSFVHQHILTIYANTLSLKYIMVWFQMLSHRQTPMKKKLLFCYKHRHAIVTRSFSSKAACLDSCNDTKEFRIIACMLLLLFPFRSIKPKVSYILIWCILLENIKLSTPSDHCCLRAGKSIDMQHTYCWKWLVD